MAAMYETNPEEMLGFLSSPYSIPLFLGGAIVLGLIVWYILRSKPLWKLKNETSIRRGYLFILPVIALIFFLIEGKTILFTFPVDVFYLNYNYIEESHAKTIYLKTPYRFKANKEDKQRGELFVLIIGEAARRSALHAYGAELETTPRLDAFIKEHPENVVLFTNAVSGSAYTRGSVPTLLSTFNLKDIEHLFERPSITKMFRGAGFKTTYITTRPRYLFSNIVSTFQDDAEILHYLTTPKKKSYDESDIPIFKNFINQHDKEDKFVIIHLMGSHMQYIRQYPESESYFKNGDVMIDSYNDTIRYSDKVIMGAVDVIMHKKYPAFLLYASDHGENLNDYGDGNFGHGTKEFTRFEFEIPFILFFNNAFLEKYPALVASIRKVRNLPINQDNISHTLLGLAGIKDKSYYCPDEDLSSEKFKTHKRSIIDENMNIYNYDALHLEERVLKSEFKEDERCPKK
jgi:heptose-I-phosphate ethanolaminephosphotransferase